MTELLERGELLEQLDALGAEGGRLVFVGGEAGVGKTALARSFSGSANGPVLFSGLVAGSGVNGVVVVPGFTFGVWTVCIDLAVSASQLVATGEFDSAGDGSLVYSYAMPASPSACPAANRDVQISMTNSAGGGGVTALFYNLP